MPIPIYLPISFIIGESGVGAFEPEYPVGMRCSKWLSRCLTKSQYRIWGAQELHRIGGCRLNTVVIIKPTHQLVSKDQDAILFTGRR